MLQSRRLQVLSPCDSFVGAPAVGERPAHCTRCAKDVHDLSGMSELDVLRFAARHVGEELCVSYRVRDDGSVVTRERASPLAPAALALSLTGCAGHMASSAETRTDCVDAHGYEVDCPPGSRLDMAVIPGGAQADDETADPIDEDDQGPLVVQSDDPREGERLAESDESVPASRAVLEGATPSIAVEQPEPTTSSCGIPPKALRAAFWSRAHGLRMGKLRIPSVEEMCDDPDTRRRAEKIERRMARRAAR